MRAIGLGVNESEVCVELLEHCELDCILLAGRYTLLEQPALAELLPLCGQRGVSIICGGPFNSGILAAGSRGGANAHYNYARAAGARARARAPGSKRCARISTCRCRRPRCSSRSGIRASRASSRAAPAAPRRAIARRCSRIRSRPAFWRALRERGLVDARRAAARDAAMSTRIDSHQHFWRLDRGDYGWLTPALAPIYRDYLPADLAPQLAAAGVGSTILVQAAPTVAETRFLLAARARERVHRRRRRLGRFRERRTPPMRSRELARDAQLVGLRPDDPGHPGS